jgi:hypothetical protein
LKRQGKIYRNDFYNQTIDEPARVSGSAAATNNPQSVAGLLVLDGDFETFMGYKAHSKIQEIMHKDFDLGEYQSVVFLNHLLQAYIVLFDNRESGVKGSFRFHAIRVLQYIANATRSKHKERDLL